MRGLMKLFVDSLPDFQFVFVFDEVLMFFSVSLFPEFFFLYQNQ